MLVLGAVQTAAFVWPQLGWPLPLLAGGWLVWRLNQASAGRAALLGWCYGLGWLCAGVWWLFISMHRYGGLPAPLAAAAVLALSAALSLYLALACAGYARWRRGRALPDALLWASLWLLAELARGLLFTGFPWVAAGYAWVDSPWAGLAPWIGVYGLGALMAFGMAILAPAGRWRAGFTAAQGRWGLGLAAITLAVATLLPLDHTRPAGRLTLSLIQTDVAQDEKFVVERLPQTLAWLAQALQQAPGELVVAPETAVPLLPGQLEALVPGYWGALEQHFLAQRRYALVGVPLGSFETGYTNSVAGLGPGASYRYDKQHLVPFGEFIPPGFRWFTELMNIPLGDFGRGPLDAPSFSVAGQRVAPNICYEDLFGEELAVRFVDEARAPTILANLSNIGWFGHTIALPQHLHISRMRSLELQRPMLRSTNTGVTALIDHRGQVLSQLPPFTRGTLSGSVEGRSGTTPYAAWAGRFGLWPLIGLALAVVVTLSVSRRQDPGVPADPGARP